jgi:hypothetical protein
MLPRLVVLAAQLLLASCAAVPGYMPPPLEESSRKAGTLGKPLESGDVSEAGRYEMSAAEKAMDCKRLTGSMQITIRRLKDPVGREEPSALASSAEKMATPLYGGSGKTTDRKAVYARERAKVDAYNDELAAKGCKTIDIEAELARPPEGPKKY